jgi:RimJ/RimL family protein N-acetyltransferase
MNLKPVEQADLAVVSPWFSPPGTGCFIEEDWLASAWRKAEYESERHSLLLGCQDGEPVSLISVSQNPGEGRPVVSMIVKRDVRGTGIGRATLEALRDIYPDAEEFVGYVDPENSKSIALLMSDGWIRTPLVINERAVFVRRRDGGPLPEDWRPPQIPL